MTSKLISHPQPTLSSMEHYLKNIQLQPPTSTPWQGYQDQMDQCRSLFHHSLHSLQLQTVYYVRLFRQWHELIANVSPSDDHRPYRLRAEPPVQQKNKETPLMENTEAERRPTTSSSEGSNDAPIGQKPQKTMGLLDHIHNLNVSFRGMNESEWTVSRCREFYSARPFMVGVVGAGGAVGLTILDALLEFLPANTIRACTPNLEWEGWSAYKEKGVKVSFDYTKIANQCQFIIVASPQSQVARIVTRIRAQLNCPCMTTFLSLMGGYSLQKTQSLFSEFRANLNPVVLQPYVDVELLAQHVPPVKKALFLHERELVKKAEGMDLCPEQPAKIGAYPGAKDSAKEYALQALLQLAYHTGVEYPFATKASTEILELDPSFWLRSLEKLGSWRAWQDVLDARIGSGDGTLRSSLQSLQLVVAEL